jgi:hypothetical protein
VGRRTARLAAVGPIVGCIVALAALLGTSGPASAAVPLPDGRAWEMVSPLDKNGGDILGIGRFASGGVVQAGVSGDEITYIAGTSFAKPEGASANQYLSTRHGSEGWSTQNITTPAISGTSGLAGTGAPYKAFSSDLSLGLVLNGEYTAGEAAIENPPLTDDAPPGYQNFYLRASSDGGLRALMTSPPPQPTRGFHMRFEEATPDLQHVVVSSEAALTTGAIASETSANLYEWAEGSFRAVNVLPEAQNGVETTPGAVLGSGFGESHTVSNDGSRVFWLDRGTDKLYARKDEATTVRLDASQGVQGGVAGEVAEPLFQGASSDGSAAFFTSHAPLTSDAHTGPSCGACRRAGNDLYRFEITSGVLSDLSADPADPNGAEVQGVLGASEDGSYVYFVAKGVLASVNGEGHEPIAGADNLYVWHEGPAAHVTTTFIGALSGNDASDWNDEVLHRTARVAPAGQGVVFVSDVSLTGYDNLDAATGNPDDEVYLYDATSSHLSCASCNPSGARPIASSSIPGGTPFELRANGGAVYQSRVSSDGGRRVFFDSGDALVPQDGNGRQDVYGYENGHVYLISGGVSSEASEFVDASVSGDDVFFLTRQQLTRGDTDQLVDLYDARVGGGIPEPVPPPPCTDESCRSPVSPVGSPLSLGSASFTGLGNLPPVASKPVSKPKPKHRAKAKKSHRAKKRNTKGRKSKAQPSARAGRIPRSPGGGR